MRSQRLQSAQNSYWALRHGQSEANRCGLIVSTPFSGCHAYGLTDAGREQVQTELQGFPDRPIILCSDFLRTRQTAEIAALITGGPPPICDPRLRERFFGRWEGSRDGNYHLAWQRDEQNPHHSDYDVEPVVKVLQRMLSVVEEAEQRWRGRTILLVSHGDPLQILQTAFAGIAPGKHRSLPQLRPGNIRLLCSR